MLFKSLNVPLFLQTRYRNMRFLNYGETDIENKGRLNYSPKFLLCLNMLFKSLYVSSFLSDSLQECEVSKLRRDWAFSERDKIVQERESIRTLCDKLRRERDRAVSELAEALRDSDDLKKQRNTISKETKELR